MSDAEKKPTLDEQVAEAMKKASLNGGIMGQAMKMTNLAYAFQFAQSAKPKVAVANAHLDSPNPETLLECLIRIHRENGLIVSVVQENPGVFLVVYYALEK